MSTMSTQPVHFAPAAALICAAAAIAIAACSDTLGPDDEVVRTDDPRWIIRLSGGPDGAITVGDTVRYYGSAHRTGGERVSDTLIQWSSSNPSVATVDQTGLATGFSPGQTIIRLARADGGPGSASKALSVTLPVATVDVTPTEVRLISGGLINLSATPRDAEGNGIHHREAEWSTSDSAIATVDQWGLVTSIAPGTATITATVAGVEGHATVTVRTVRLQSVTAGSGTTCGVSEEGVAVCWGSRYNQWALVEVLTDFPLAALDGGGAHTCGLAADGQAVCWGASFAGQLGNGSQQSSGKPVLVSGGHRFRTVSAGGSHTCAIGDNGVAYCWGINEDGQLGTTFSEECVVGVPVKGGDKTTRACSLRPVRVEGDLLLGAVTAGGTHTCALAADGTAYCWGANSNGQLGRADPEDFTATPREVSGGLTFTSLSAGSGHTCGIAQAGIAFCWGANDEGQLGDGTTEDRLEPVPVSGGLTFTSLSGGNRHTCGVAVGGTAYCWGSNNAGKLGDGTSNASLEPVPVAGDLTFESVTAGSDHTCGRTVDGVVYCWGSNGTGQLGVSEPQESSVPIRVAGQP